MTLYSTGCPKCIALKEMLDEKNIIYSTVDDVDDMINKGFDKVPILEVDGKYLDFYNALQWLKGASQI